MLIQTVELPLLNVLGASFAIAGLVKCAAALLLAMCLLAWRSTPAALLLALGAVELAAATLSTHAAARMDHSLPLLGVEALHQLGAAIWIGGIPAFSSRSAACTTGAPGDASAPASRACRWRALPASCCRAAC